MSKAVAVESYKGPTRLLRVNGRVQVTVRWRSAAHDYLPAAWVASALGWGHQLVGESQSKDALVEYCRARFPGCEVREQEVEK